MLNLLLGGARSGKSALAVSMAVAARAPVSFIATGQALDDEMAARVAAHRAERPPEWSTVEAPLDLDRALTELPPRRAAIVDCLTLWVSNLMSAGRDDETVLNAARQAAALASAHSGLVVVVTNEVGSGIVPFEALTRRYRDLMGRVNATFALQANDAFLVVAGRVLTLAPGPPHVASSGTTPPSR